MHMHKLGTDTTIGS